VAVSVLFRHRETDPRRWRLPGRRDINFVLNATLASLLILSFASGWLASWMGLTEFGLHKWTSIGVFVLALAHLALHWRSLAAHLRRRLGGGRPPASVHVLRLIETDFQHSLTAKAVDDLTATGT
jgi:predicted ferric reductase